MELLPVPDPQLLSRATVFKKLHPLFICIQLSASVAWVQRYHDSLGLIDPVEKVMSNKSDRQYATSREWFKIEICIQLRIFSLKLRQQSRYVKKQQGNYD